MAITTANELRTAVQNWANESTTLTTDRLNECIALFEAHFNRHVRVKGQEATMTSTALSSGAASLPSGFRAWKELRFDGDSEYTLQPKSLEWIRAKGDADTSEAQYFAITSTQVVCWPLGGPIKGTYYQALTSLTGLTTTGNWLLTSHPDIYLSGVLAEALLYLENEERAAIVAGRNRELIKQLELGDQSDDFEGGPIAARAR